METGKAQVAELVGSSFVTRSDMIYRWGFVLGETVPADLAAVTVSLDKSLPHRFRFLRAHHGCCRFCHLS